MARGCVASHRSTIDAPTHCEMPLEPVDVQYCSLCGCPPEFCEYAGCNAAKVEAAMGAVTVSGEGGSAGGVGEPAAATAAGGEAGEEKKAGGGKNKKKKEKMVTITRTTRNKKKTVTTVSGLDAFDVKLAEASKLFGKKFACGASVTKAATGKEEIDVQGDFSEEMKALIVDKFGVDADLIKLVDKGK